MSESQSPTGARGSLRPPSALAPASVVSVLLALVLVALAVVAVRDLVVAQGWAAGTPWLSERWDGVTSVTGSAGLTTAGCLLAVAGLVLWLAALMPARRTHLPTRTDSDLWVSTSAAGLLAREVAERTSGVTAADVSVGRRRLRVDVVTSSDARPSDVEAEVRSRLEATPALPPLRVTARTTSSPSQEATR